MSMEDLFNISNIAIDILIASGCANEVTLNELERLEKKAFNEVIESIQQLT